MADNKVRFGLQNVYVAFKTDSGYDTPVHIPGAVNLTMNPEGNQDVFYADNIPYVTFSSNSGYTGELEMAIIPDAVLAQMFGWEVDSNGALVENASGTPKSFALIYEVKGDAKSRRNVFYNVSAARPSGSAATTTDTTDPNTETLSITMIPAQFTSGTGANAVTRNVTKASMELTNDNAAVYNTFFSAVYVPTFSA